MVRNIDLRANGKLLISGEYLVLFGARALALPLRFGQTLKVVEIPEPVIRWKSYQPEGLWFSCELELPYRTIISANDMVIARRLDTVLHSATTLNPDFLEIKGGLSVTLETDYPVKWGLGSSSTFYYLLARWSGTDPFTLMRMTQTGSGYDLACAERKNLLFYRLEEEKNQIVEDASPGKALREFTYFTYLGNKADTQREVSIFKRSGDHTSKDISDISSLSAEICAAGTAGELIRLVREHETIMGRILRLEPIAARFPDFPGAVKSLGAWGGDFAMFVSGEEPGVVKRLLNKKGYKEIFSYDEIKARE